MPHFVIARRLCVIICAMCIHIEYKIVCVCVCVSVYRRVLINIIIYEFYVSPWVKLTYSEFTC